ncbi:FadR/GntR family transcriptional regulator [Microtetraspora fusca]|uniref:FadR/GntR family transcriptional regulator n=1 Tax=Microtetraspora fusca TaxID=1997 RepID=A0ABW6VML9_MICFU|nr:FadR/GntR family transcriptional regulator [Microtetraspora fusca]
MPGVPDRQQPSDRSGGLHDRVLDQLGPAIVSGETPEGEVLRIERLEESLGVSRTVMREAVRVLESMQLVASRRRIGVTVLPRSQWNLFDPRIIRWRLAGPDRMAQLESLSQLRCGIEPVAASLAATRCTPEQCGTLTSAVIGMSVTAKRGDLDAYLEHDITFHRTILEASGNEMFSGLAQVVAEVLAGRTHHNLMPAEPETAAIRLHGDVAEAVQLGHSREAETAMRAIVLESIEAMSLNTGLGMV